MSDNFEYNDEVSKLQNFLIEKGIMELYGMTKDGDVTFKINMVLLKETFPQLYDLIQSDMNETLIDLYQKGVVDISYDENLEASFGLSKDAIDFLQEKGYDIPNFYEE